MNSEKDGVVGESQTPVSTDPVCGMQVSDPSALHLEHGGTSYPFCSTACRDAFVGEPTRYAT